MNVAFDPWIPVVTISGKPTLASIAKVLSSGEEFADLAVRPHERVALMRLFLCVAHAALKGPKDYDEWKTVPQRLPDASQKYLGKWKGSFELFDNKKPWLQVADLSIKDTGEITSDHFSNWTPVSKLDFSLATGNASTLFDHEGMAPREREVQLHCIILAMLTFQCFSVGGLIGQIFWNGIRCGELANTSRANGPVKSADGPCIPSSMLHALLRSETITKTIWLNIPTYDDISASYGNVTFGKPIWEKMPSNLTSCSNIANATETYVGRLVPLTRVIRLHPSGKCMLLGNGLTYGSFSSGFPQEPTATVIKKGDKRFLLSYRPSKALWRELAAIIVKRTADGLGGPLSLRALEDGEGCDLTISALARDKATIVDGIESHYNLPSQMLMDKGMASYDTEVKNAENLADLLAWAINIYRKEVDKGWEGKLKAAGPAKGKLKAKLHKNTTTHYWTTIEKHLSLLMKHIKAIGTDDAIPTRKNWRNKLFQSACDAYQISCGQETPRQMRAFAKGWQKLTDFRNNPEPRNNNNMEEKP